MSPLSPAARLLLANVAANARLEGQDLPEEDQALAAAYLAGEIDAATFEERVVQLINGAISPQARTA